MKDELFTELVDLYLDQEINEAELAQLKSALEGDPARRRAFHDRRRLHQAMQLALDPEMSLDAQPSLSESARAVFPRWFLGAGLAASLSIAGVFIFAVIQPGARTLSWGMVADVLLLEDAITSAPAGAAGIADPLDSISRSELRRFAVRQQQSAVTQRTSLAAKLRLMGLRPELTPHDKELRVVNLASVQPREPSISLEDRLERMQRLSAMPEPRILQFEEPEQVSTSLMMSGFHSSLASFY
ncbi:MAG: hypothetical protein EA353_06735 [Puniceicoccaceae bacterium]|nr:MAG: hypothetical protein EA353_06735 [Puniceicoccaceae bacterium]